MEAWLNFACVLVGQFAVFVLAALMRRLRFSHAATLLLASLLLGAPVGVAFDVFLGHEQSVFSYDSAPAWQLFPAVNGILSYGLAIATAWMMPVPLERQRRLSFRIAGLVALPSAMSLMVYLRALALPSVPAMFAWGVLVLLAGEALAAATGRKGPLLAAAYGQLSPLFTLSVASAVIGAVYETLNWLWPVWNWRAVEGPNGWLVEVLIIGLGYVVLFQPLLILSRVLMDALRSGQDAESH